MERLRNLAIALVAALAAPACDRSGSDRASAPTTTGSDPQSAAAGPGAGSGAGPGRGATTTGASTGEPGEALLADQAPDARAGRDGGAAGGTMESTGGTATDAGGPGVDGRGK